MSQVIRLTLLILSGNYNYNRQHSNYTQTANVKSETATNGVILSFNASRAVLALACDVSSNTGHELGHERWKELRCWRYFTNDQNSVVASVRKRSLLFSLEKPDRWCPLVYMSQKPEDMCVHNLAAQRGSSTRQRQASHRSVWTSG